MDNIIKAKGMLEENNYKPHYFPDIPVEYLSDGRGGSGKDGSIKNISFNNKGKANYDQLNGFSGDGQFVPENQEKNQKNKNNIEELAYARGFEKGEYAGSEAEKKKIDPILHQFSQALLDLEKIKREIYFNAENDTVELALTIAGKILCQEVSIKKEVVLSVVREALKEVVGHDKIKVRLNPSDMLIVKNAQVEIVNSVHNTDSVAFEEDGSISSGGCVIETNFGEIDARIERQFKVVQEAFRSVLEKSGSLP